MLANSAIVVFGSLQVNLKILFTHINFCLKQIKSKLEVSLRGKVSKYQIFMFVKGGKGASYIIIGTSVA